MRRFRSGSVVLVGLALLLTVAGCKKNAAGTQAMDPHDPANVNMAPVSGPVSGPVSQPQQVLGQRQAGDQYAQGEQYPDSQAGNDEADQAPPPLPEYAQPVATRPNTIWTPGYWQHSPTGYYWVPGAWVAPPYTGALWTPGYWGADGPRFRFHLGYWGRHVGFYGGIPYGGGYTGTGYRGGYWRGDQFYYNRAVNRVDPNYIHEYYDQPEPVYGGVRVSFNGGRGGIALLPIAAELIAMHEEHERPIRFQFDLERRAGSNRGQFFGYNQGRPENYFAPEGYIEDEGRFDGPGRGHAYGHFKDHGDEGYGHEDNGNGRGRGDEGNGHGHGNEGNGRGHGDEGNGHGNGHGDEGHGHGGGEGNGHGHK